MMVPNIPVNEIPDSISALNLQKLFKNKYNFDVNVHTTFNEYINGWLLIPKQKHYARKSSSVYSREQIMLFLLIQFFLVTISLERMEDALKDTSDNLEKFYSTIYDFRQKSKFMLSQVNMDNPFGRSFKGILLMELTAQIYDEGRK